MKTMLRMLLVAAFLLNASPTSAVTIAFGLTPLAGNEYEYTYTVTNDSLAQALQAFTVFFPLGLYDNLSVTSPVADWDEVAVDPDPLFLAAGFYDALAQVGGIAPSAALDGFSVRFTWLGSGQPGAQPFTVTDPLSSATLASGTTVPLAPGRIPLPGSAWLMVAGLLGWLGQRRCTAAGSGFRVLQSAFQR